MGYEYKESGSKWYPLIPLHWKVERGKALYSKENRKPEENAEVVTCFRDGQVTLRKNRRTSGFTESLKEIGYQGVKKGDLVIHVMDAFAGSIGVSDSDGKGTPVYSVCTPITDANNYYFAYLLRELARAGLIQSLYRGIRERSSDFRFDVFAAQYYPVPPRDEQDQIVRYLDWQVSKINKLIHGYQRQIKLLEERKLTVINNAVTKGIASSVRLKMVDSNWTGDIPAHWDFGTIKQHFKIRKRIAGEEGYDVISITQQGLKVKNVASNEGQIAANYANYQFVYPGDFAMNHMDLLTGFVGLSNMFGVTSPDYRVFTLEDTENCDPEYYLYIFQLGYKRKIFYGLGKGAASKGRWRMPAINFNNFGIPIPPIEEQHEIVRYIKEQEEKICVLIEGIEKQIELLKEYRTRLISDVVTGQKDVRGIVIPDYEPEADTDIPEDCEEDIEESEQEVEQDE